MPQQIAVIGKSSEFKVTNAAYQMSPTETTELTTFCASSIKFIDPSNPAVTAKCALFTQSPSFSDKIGLNCNGAEQAGFLETNSAYGTISKNPRADPWSMRSARSAMQLAGFGNYTYPSGTKMPAVLLPFTGELPVATSVINGEQVANSAEAWLWYRNEFAISASHTIAIPLNGQTLVTIDKTIHSAPGSAPGDCSEEQFHLTSEFLSLTASTAEAVLLTVTYNSLEVISSCEFPVVDFNQVLGSVGGAAALVVVVNVFIVLGLAKFCNTISDDDVADEALLVPKALLG